MLKLRRRAPPVQAHVRSSVRLTGHAAALIDHRDSWPLWRRWLRLPDGAAIVRRQAWKALHESVELHARMGPPGISLPLRGRGIFNSSRAHLHLLELGRSLPRSFVMRGIPRGASRGGQWPAAGPLTLTAKFDDFGCDIADVEGLCASKSSGLFFKDVHSFGQSFRDFKGFTVDESGLRAALRHSEIRVIHSPGVDCLSLYLWDDRLFLDNAVGSHHFAAAAYLAREIGAAIPLTAPLWLHSLNEPVWDALLDAYRILLAPTPGISPAPLIADICGDCHELQLPGAIAEGKLVFVPRRAQSVEPVTELLRQAGVTEVTAWWTQALAKQHEALARLRHRWPELLPGSTNASS
jgi:hypothetical protein